jgi:hypothetical protein
MRHRAAKRLLPSLPDQTLPVGVEMAVRCHVETCGRCQRTLDDIETAEELMRRLPAALFPIESEPPRTYRRLVSLAHWSGDPDIPAPDGWRAPILSIVCFLSCVVMAAAVGQYSPTLDFHGGAPMIVAQNLPAASYLPMGWASARP